MKECIATERAGSTKQLNELITAFGKLYEEVVRLKNKFTNNNKKAIVVFNYTSQRNMVYQTYKITDWQKLVFYVSEIFEGCKKRQDFYVDPICEPLELIWKNVGEVSVVQTWARIKTTVILLVGFMVLSFFVICLPPVILFDGDLL
jgi:hypothetical protein